MTVQFAHIFSFSLNRLLTEKEKENVLNFILKKTEYKQVDKFILEDNKVVFWNNIVSFTPRAWGYIDKGEFWFNDPGSYTVLRYKFYFGKKLFSIIILWVVVFGCAITSENLQIKQALAPFFAIVLVSLIISWLKIYIGQNNILYSIASEINDYYK